MTPARTRPGGPLVALAAIMALWIAGRMAVSNFGIPVEIGPTDHSPPAGFARLQSPDWPTRSIGAPARTTPSLANAPVARPSPALLVPPASPRFAPLAPPAQPRLETARVAPVPVAVAAGHQIAWMAALSRLPLPAGFAAAQAAPPTGPVTFFPTPAAGVSNGRRWSADGWLLLRRGANGSLAAGALAPSYGASQAGAVLRYRLAPASALRPEAYARLATALDSPADKEAAVGLSARPLVALPLRALAELRVSEQSGATRLRPAALVVTELQPVDLPHGVRAEFYGQAGYVGGRHATAFADGQARIDARVADLGGGKLRAGAGAWAGVQKGAARLDLGPSATLGVPFGDAASARLGLDWRLRVAGDAQPGSGIALTLSAGF